MNSIIKLGKTLAVSIVLAVVAIGAGLLVAWYIGNRGSVAPAAFNTKVAQSPVVPAPVWTPDHATPPPIKRVETSTTLSPSPGSYGMERDTRPPEQQLEDILLGAGDENAKSDRILALLTNSPPEAQKELSEHLKNMTQDDHYDGVAQLLTNAATQPEVSTVLMNDLLNRQNILKLPMLLAIARTPDHPLAGQAKDMLELFIQTDYSTNWDQWSEAITTWLQQNGQ